MVPNILDVGNNLGLYGWAIPYSLNLGWFPLNQTRFEPFMAGFAYLILCADRAVPAASSSLCSSSLRSSDVIKTNEGSIEHGVCCLLGKQRIREVKVPLAALERSKQLNLTEQAQLHGKGEFLRFLELT